MMQNSKLLDSCLDLLLLVSVEVSQARVGCCHLQTVLYPRLKLFQMVSYSFASFELSYSYYLYPHCYCFQECPTYWECFCQPDFHLLRGLLSRGSWWPCLYADLFASLLLYCQTLISALKLGTEPLFARGIATLKGLVDQLIKYVEVTIKCKLFIGMRIKLTV